MKIGYSKGVVSSSVYLKRIRFKDLCPRDEDNGLQWVVSSTVKNRDKWNNYRISRISVTHSVKHLIFMTGRGNET